MGGVVSAGVDNDDLVDKLKEADYIKTQTVEKIFRLVDRGYYMTKDSQNIAYRDNAWRSGNLHISAPCIYAQVMEGLQIGAGMSFLNIGSGTGYLSTMAGLLIGPNGINHGIEVHGDVVQYARERLSCFLSNTGSIDVCFFCEPQFSQGNALCLKEDTLLYDRVYCGASCPSSHENYMKNLIKVNGILVMPRNDKLMKIVRTGKCSWTSESLLPVSFSSLVMPDNSLATETVELPPVNNISLQELSREAIRLIFRKRIEEETESLKTAFVYTIPENSSPRTRRSASRFDKNFPITSLSDTEDTEDSEDGEGDWERFGGGSSHNLQDSMHTAFIELARNFMSRGVSNLERRERGDMAEEQEDGEEVEVEVEEEEEEEEDNNVGERSEMILSNGHDLIVRIIERVNRATRPNDNASSSTPRGASSSLPTTLNDTEASVALNPDTNTTEVAEVNTNEKDNDFDPEESHARSEDEMMVEEDDKDIDEAIQDEDVKDNENNTNNISNSAHDSVIEDEEMKEEHNKNIAEKAPLCQNVEKEVKKREKFDSGIVEDLDHAMSIDSSSSCSFKSRSNSASSLSDSDETKKAPQPNPPDSPDCSFRNNSTNHNRVWNKLKMNRRKKRTLKYDNESKTDSSVPINKYSQQMKAKINELPLPLPLKIFVNYNRPL